MFEFFGQIWDALTMIVGMIVQGVTTLFSVFTFFGSLFGIVPEIFSGVPFLSTFLASALVLLLIVLGYRLIRG